MNAKTHKDLVIEFISYTTLCVYGGKKPFSGGFLLVRNIQKMNSMPNHESEKFHLLFRTTLAGCLWVCVCGLDSKNVIRNFKFYFMCIFFYRVERWWWFAFFFASLGWWKMRNRLLNLCFNDAAMGNCVCTVKIVFHFFNDLCKMKDKKVDWR
jgi:hypothetical protein